MVSPSPPADELTAISVTGTFPELRMRAHGTARFPSSWPDASFGDTASMTGRTSSEGRSTAPGPCAIDSSVDRAAGVGPGRAGTAVHAVVAAAGRAAARTRA